MVMSMGNENISRAAFQRSTRGCLLLISTYFLLDVWKIVVKWERRVCMALSFASQTLNLKSMQSTSFENSPKLSFMCSSLSSNPKFKLHMVSGISWVSYSYTGSRLFCLKPRSQEISAIFPLPSLQINLKRRLFLFRKYFHKRTVIRNAGCYKDQNIIYSYQMTSLFSLQDGQ